MPRVLPFPEVEWPEVEMLELVFGEATRVTGEHLKLLGHHPPDPIPGLRRFARSVMQYRADHGLTPVRRYFIVACAHCPEVYLISAGPRGGSWQGKCVTCSKKAGDSPKAAVIEEIENESEDT